MTLEPKLTRSEILQTLCKDTHAFWTPEFVTKINDAFGTKLECYTAKATGHKDPKGLTLNNGASSATGLASFEIAPMLCRHFNVKYESKLGRGSQVRACVQALREMGFDKP